MKTITSTSIFLAALLIFFVFAGKSFSQTDERGMRIRTAPQVTQWPSQAKRYALIIGIDEYQDPQISRLEGASRDAKTLTDALIRYAGFPSEQVILLTTDQPVERKPTRNNILRRLANLRGTVPQDGLLLLAFAGHGIERDGRAYLLPADAQVGDIALLEDTAIGVTTLKERISQTKVGQIVLILDACRNDPSAGRGDADNKLTQAYTRGFNFDSRNQEITAFVTLYATEVGSRAYEYKEKNQGYFTWALVEGLKGAAANSKGEVTLSGLISYLQDRVPKLTSLDLGSNKKQRPFAQIEGYKAEDLVIAVGRPRSGPSTKAMAWQLGSQLSLAALVYDSGRSDLAASPLENAKILAAEIGMQLPAFPPRTGEKAKDSASIIHYLLDEAGKPLKKLLAERYGLEQGLLFEVAIKSNMLMMIYLPGDDLGTTIGGVLKRDGSRSGLPENLWKPVSDKIEARASFEEVKQAVFNMHKEVRNYLLSNR